MIETNAELHAALASERPFESLWRTVKRSRDAGSPRDRLLAQLDELRSELHRTGRHEAEDTVLDVMDCLIGWCSPHQRL
jgi:hypothetical protein